MKKILVFAIVIILIGTLIPRLSGKKDDEAPNETHTSTELASRPGSAEDSGKHDDGVKVTYSLMSEIDFEAEELEIYKKLNKIFEENKGDELRRPDTQGDSSVYCHNGEYMHESGKATVDLEKSVGYSFAVLSSKLNANPFYNFKLISKAVKLENIPLYGDKENEYGMIFDSTILEGFGGNMEFNESRFEVEEDEYIYDSEGCRMFLQDVISLMRTNNGNRNNLSVYGRTPSVHYSEKDKCYYSFIVKYDTSYAYINAIYFRSDKGRIIDNVTVQSMSISYNTSDYAAGVSNYFAYNELTTDFEIVTMISAIEQVLAGTCYLEGKDYLPREHFGQSYFFPRSYKAGDYRASLVSECFCAVDIEDLFRVYTYSLKK